MKERFVFIWICFMISLLLIVSMQFHANAVEPAKTKIGGKTNMPDKVSSKQDQVKKLEEEIKALKEEMQNLRKEMEDIKTKIIARQPAPPPEPQDAVVSVDNDPVKGNSDAPVTIVEFSDYQCPFCGRFSKTTLPEIDRDYIKTGKVKYVFRDFPLDFHNDAPKAAEAANCAGEQGKYWEMHDKLFENQVDLKVDKLRQYAADIGIDSDPFNLCLDSGKYEGEIKADIEDGKKAEVSGTPSFFIGKSQGQAKEITGKRVVGARPYQAFKQVIDQMLSEQK